MMDENDRYQEYFDYFSDQLSMDLLKKDYPYDSEMLDNILELIVETVCTKRPLIRIGAEERPAEIVRSRFMKLNSLKPCCIRRQSGTGAFSHPSSQQASHG